MWIHKNACDNSVAVVREQETSVPSLQQDGVQQKQRQETHAGKKIV